MERLMAVMFDEAHCITKWYDNSNLVFQFCQSTLGESHSEKA